MFHSPANALAMIIHEQFDTHIDFVQCDSPLQIARSVTFGSKWRERHDFIPDNRADIRHHGAINGTYRRVHEQDARITGTDIGYYQKSDCRSN